MEQNLSGPTRSESVRGNIRGLRKARHWSLVALAAELKRIGLPIDRIRLGRIEAGQREATVGELDAIAQALGVELTELLMNERERQRADFKAHMVSVEAIREIREQMGHEVVAAVRAIAQADPPLSFGIGDRAGTADHG